MDETIKNMIGAMPEESRIICRLTLQLEPVGGLILESGGVPVAKALFIHMYGEEILKNIENRLIKDEQDILSWFRASEMTGPIVNLAAIEKLAKRDAP